MMHGHHQHMLLFRQSEQACPDERSELEIKRFLYFVARQCSSCFFHILRTVTQINDGKRYSDCVVNNLSRPTIHNFKLSTQRFMARYDFLQYPLQYGQIKKTFYTNSGRNVIGGSTWGHA